MSTSLADQDVHEKNEHATLILEAKRTMRDTRGVDRLERKLREDPASLTEAEKKQVEFSTVRLGAYHSMPSEVWARLVEQYVRAEHPAGQRLESADDHYERAPAYWSAEAFAPLKPLVKAELDRRVRILREAAQQAAPAEPAT